MRTLRLFLMIVLGALLICVALANRATVTVNLLPPSLADSIGGRWSANMPLFLLIFLALLIGIALGLIGEWIREAQFRSEASKRRKEIAARRRAAANGGQPLPADVDGNRDDVLDILDAAPRRDANAGKGPVTVPDRTALARPGTAGALPGPVVRS